CAGMEPVEQRRRVKPASAARVKEPATVMIGRPAPGLEADPSPAKGGIQDPLSLGKRGPCGTDAEGPPAKAISPAVKPGAVRIEAAESRRIIGELVYCIVAAVAVETVSI